MKCRQRYASNIKTIFVKHNRLGKDIPHTTNQKNAGKPIILEKQNNINKSKGLIIMKKGQFIKQT